MGFLGPHQNLQTRLLGYFFVSLFVTFRNFWSLFWHFLVIHSRVFESCCFALFVTFRHFSSLLTTFDHFSSTFGALFAFFPGSSENNASCGAVLLGKLFQGHQRRLFPVGPYFWSLFVTFGHFSSTFGVTFRGFCLKFDTFDPFSSTFDHFLTTFDTKTTPKKCRKK